MLVTSPKAPSQTLLRLKCKLKELSPVLSGGILWKAIWEPILKHSSIRMTIGGGTWLRCRGLGPQPPTYREWQEIKIGLGLNCFIQLADFQAARVHLSGLNESVLRTLSLEWHLDCLQWQRLLSLIMSSALFVSWFGALKWSEFYKGLKRGTGSLYLLFLCSNRTLGKSLKGLLYWGMTVVDLLWHAKLACSTAERNRYSRNTVTSLGEI